MPLKPCLDCGRISTGVDVRVVPAREPVPADAWRRVSDFVVARDGSCRDAAPRVGVLLVAVHKRYENGDRVPLLPILPPEERDPQPSLFGRVTGIYVAVTPLLDVWVGDRPLQEAPGAPAIPLTTIGR